MSRMKLTLFIGILLLFFGVLFVWMGPASTIFSPAIRLLNTAIPFVPTRHDTMRDLLWMADVGTNDVVYDLGSGDGRVVIAAVRDFHARRAVGIELDEKLVRESRANAAAAGVADRVKFIHGDLFTNDFSAASVVVLYLGHGANLGLRPQIIRTLKSGARVVSHQFGMGEWARDKFLDVRTDYFGMYGTVLSEFRDNPDVPDFNAGREVPTHDTLSVWIVPAPVAGVWRGSVQSDSGKTELKLILHQRLSGLSGTFQFQGPTNIQGYVRVDLWGDHLRCWCIPTNASRYADQMWFDGHIQGDRLDGGLWMVQGTNAIETQWTARRAPTDFNGTWEWTVPSNAPVQLKIEHQDKCLVLTYTDKNRQETRWDDAEPIPVFDAYDFGGGFYFTLLLGADQPSYRGGSRSREPKDGWLIGEAIMDDGELKGTLIFYPYPFSRPQTSGASTPPSDRLDWMPKRVAP